MAYSILKRTVLALGLGGSAFALSGCDGVAVGFGVGYGYDPFYDSMLWNDYYRRDVDVDIDVDRPVRPNPPAGKPPSRPNPPAGKPPARPKPPVAKPPARPRPPVARPPTARPPIHRPGPRR
ncbi:MULTISPECIES: hypothetical protein [unclassified Ruegeria]|uniref:hypothetical protein n=1 Tax=unclassified Ruegeria TaxID=2625375 RepID=UPI0014878AA8|nr:MULTISPECIES: hypothetical protein [unclassified Ruegeria]